MRSRLKRAVRWLARKLREPPPWDARWDQVIYGLIKLAIFLVASHGPDLNPFG